MKNWKFNIVFNEISLVKETSSFPFNVNFTQQGAIDCKFISVESIYKIRVYELRIILLFVPVITAKIF